MKRIILFVYSLSLPFFLFTASSSSGTSEYKLPSSFLDKDVASRLKAYSAFHEVTQKNSRLERLEMAEALLGQDTRACTESMKKYAGVLFDLQRAGIELSDNQVFVSAQDDVDESRRAVNFSSALLLDVIHAKQSDVGIRVEPSSVDLQKDTQKLVERPDSPESEPFVEQFWKNKESINLIEDTYKIPRIDPLPRKEPGCNIM